MTLIKIKYPDRTANQVRNTFELIQLDGVGVQLMEQQQVRETKEREKENLLRQMASQTGVSSAEARATQQFHSPISTPPATPTPPRSATDFYLQPPTPSWSGLFAHVPPYQPRDLLFGPSPGPRTQIHDLAASESSYTDLMHVVVD